MSYAIQLGNHEVEFALNWGLVVGFEVIPHRDIHNRNRVQRISLCLELGIIGLIATFQLRRPS